MSSGDCPVCRGAQYVQRRDGRLIACPRWDKATGKCSRLADGAVVIAGGRDMRQHALADAMAGPGVTA